MEPSPEPRWPSAVSAIAAGALFYALPPGWLPGPAWLMLALVAGLLVPLMHTHRAGLHDWNHRLGILLSSLLTAALVGALAALIAALPSREESAVELLLSGSAIWGANVLVFANWYWRLDAGGPHQRFLRESHDKGAFLFPQMTLDPNSGWRPGFVDYLFLAFNTNTAFSPTDVAPLDGWAKMLMMAQSLIALATIAILAGRAVNIM